MVLILIHPSKLTRTDLVNSCNSPPKTSWVHLIEVIKYIVKNKQTNKEVSKYIGNRHGDHLSLVLKHLVY